MATILVTGGAGFIGAHVSRALLSRGDRVVVVDNFNPYYDPALKEARVKSLLSEFTPTVVRADLTDRSAMEKIFRDYAINKICHLAAQAGVRYSLENPRLYVESNVLGTLTLLEVSRRHGNPPFIFASSSSVYGENVKVPFSEDDRVEQPVSLYAATKRTVELLALNYHRLHGTACTGLRFFTVYGPWGRPDMAYFSFTQKMLSGATIDLYNRGNMERDFTYIDDIVRGVVAALGRPQGYELINLGNHQPVRLGEFVAMLEAALSVKANTRMLPMQPGDVPKTFADVTKAKRLLGWEPTTKLAAGLQKFVAWYRPYFRE